MSGGKLYLPDPENVDALRALCRYETHGGYVWAGVMDDGELMCVPCLRANYRQVFRATSDPRDRSGFALRGYTNSGESEQTEHCAHCDEAIWEHPDANTMRCDRCELLSINGVPCHERGCPNVGGRWDGADWIKQRECFECGCTVDAEDACCSAEPDEAPPAEQLWASTSSGRIEIQMTLEQAQSASHQGQCDDDVRALSGALGIAEQLAALDPEVLRDELREHGAWEDEQLADHSENLQRILWLLAGDVVESHGR